MGFNDVAPTLSLMIAIIAVPTSGYISYCYAIKGEKRKEFNSLAEQILIELEQIKTIWGAGNTLSVDPIPYDLIDRVRRRKRPQEREGYDAAWGKYYQCRDSLKSLNGDYLVLFVEGIKAVDHLIELHELK